MDRDLLQTLHGARVAPEGLLEEVVAGRVTRNAAVDDTAQKGRAPETVGAVHATSQLTAGEQAIKRLLLLVEHLRLVVDLDTAHGEVQHWLHDGDVEVVAHIERHVVEELLAPRVLLLALGNSVVGRERLLEVVC